MDLAIPNDSRHCPCHLGFPEDSDANPDARRFRGRDSEGNVVDFTLYQDCPVHHTVAGLMVTGDTSFSLVKCDDALDFVQIPGW